MWLWTFCQPGHKWGMQVVSGKGVCFYQWCPNWFSSPLALPAWVSQEYLKLEPSWHSPHRTWTTQIIWRHKPDRRRKKKNTWSKKCKCNPTIKATSSVTLPSEVKMRTHQIERQPMRCLQQIILLQAVCRLLHNQELSPRSLHSPWKLPCA